MAARLIAQDKYCRNSESNSLIKQNQSHLNNNSEQSPEEHNNGPRHSQEDDQRQNTNNQQSEQAKPRMHNKQRSQVKTPVESADQNPTYSGAQSPEQCVVLIWGLNHQEHYSP